MSIFGKKKKSEQLQLIKELPKFTYFKDPLGAKSFFASDLPCEVCGKKTGYLYANTFYAEQELDCICPWCIANGRAAQEYEGQFHDFELEDSSISEQDYAELFERTPGFECMQAGEWPCHCGCICSFVAHVGWSDIQDMGIEQDLQEDFERIEQSGIKRSDIKNLFLQDGHSFGYLYQCIVCEQYRLMIDLD